MLKIIGLIFIIIVLWYLALPALVVLSLVPQIRTPPINYVSFAVTKTTLQLEEGNLSIPLDLYQPRGEPRATLIIFHAANEKGKDDTRLQQIAESLARSGLAVLSPTLPSLNRQTFHPQVIDEMKQVMIYSLASSKGPWKALAFSIGVGPMLIAAASPELAGQLDLLVAFGGYLDLENVVAFHSTGESPDPFGIWLFARYYAQFLTEPDRNILYQIADRKWRDPKADVSDLAQNLGPDGQKVMALLENKNPEAVPGLLETLPPKLKDFLVVFDPAPALQKIQTPLLLLHSHRDIIIPIEESQKLLAALREKNQTAKLIELALFDHVNPHLPPPTAQNLLALYLPEFLRLYQAVLQIIY